MKGAKRKAFLAESLLGTSTLQIFRSVLTKAGDVPPLEHRQEIRESFLPNF